MGAFLAGIFLMAAFGSSASGAQDAPTLGSLPLRPLAGEARVGARTGPTIVLFWRADCAPCLLELSDLAQLRTAARPLSVTPVGLQGAPVLQVALGRLRLRGDVGYRTDADAARTLTDFGGAPPRLPLAVAFDRAGRMCGRHTGYLGTDQVRAWARACGGDDARG